MSPLQLMSHRWKKLENVFQWVNKTGFIYYNPEYISIPDRGASINACLKCSTQFQKMVNNIFESLGDYHATTKAILRGYMDTISSLLELSWFGTRRQTPVFSSAGFLFASHRWLAWNISGMWAFTQEELLPHWEMLFYRRPVSCLQQTHKIVLTFKLKTHPSRFLKGRNIQVSHLKM